MATRLDEISSAIGELREGLRTAGRDREIDRVASVKLSGELQTLGGEVRALTIAIGDMRPKVMRTWYERTLTLGILLGIGTTGGVIGSNIRALFGMLAGGRP